MQYDVYTGIHAIHQAPKNFHLPMLLAYSCNKVGNRPP